MVVQVLNLVIKAAWILLVDIAVQNLLGPEVYGTYFIALNFCLLFILLLDVGINNLNAKSMAENESYIVNKNKILILKFGLSLLYFSIVFFIGLANGIDSFYLIFLSGNQVLLTYVQYFRSNLAGMHEFLKEGIVGVIDKFIALIICMVLLVSNQMTIELFVLAQSFGLISALLIGFTLNLRFKPQNKEALSLPYGTIIKRALPFAILAALMVIYTRIDAVMMHFLLPSGSKLYTLDAEYNVGIYAQSYRLLDAANIFAVVLSGMLLPIFSRLIKKEKSPNKIAGLSAKIVLIPSLWMVSVSMFFGPWLLGNLYDFGSENEMLYSSVIFTALMIAFVAMSLVYVYGTLLTAANELKKLNYFAGLCVFLNVVLNLILIPHYSNVDRPAEGAAIATFITQWLFVLLCLFSAHRRFQFKMDWNFIGKLVMYFGILIAIYFYLRYLEYPVESMFVIYFCSSILFVFLLRLLDLKRIKFNLIRKD